MTMFLFLIAAVLRVVGLCWCLVLLRRERDGWIGCLAALFALLALRSVVILMAGDGTWTLQGGSGLTSLGELFASGLMVASVAYASRTLRERDRSRLALSRVKLELERRVEERTRDLRQSEAKFRQLAENIDAVFWLSDMDHEQTLYVSPGFEHIFGRSYKELGVGTDAWLAAVHPDDRERISQAYQKTIGREEFDEEFRIISPDGSIRWLHSRGFVVMDAEPNTFLMAGLASDITAAKENEVALRESNEELEVFAQTISHDLKAPLRAMEGFAVALSEDYARQLDDRAKSYLQLIADGAARLDMLLNDLLQHARMGRTLATGRVDLDGVMRDVIQNLEREISESGAKIEIETTLPAVTGHRALLETAMQNLISNAIKFMPEGRKPVVRIGVESHDTSHTIYVADNGIGIDPTHHDRVFSIFERLHSREAYAGTGIGLAIVKKAARLHGGQVNLESVEGEGSTFRLTLPRVAEYAPVNRDQAA